MGKTISETFGEKFERTAGFFVDKVMPEECLKIRVSMGDAVQKEINDRINDLNIAKIRTTISRIEANHPSSEDVFEKKMMLGLKQEINRRFSDISTEFSKAGNNNPLEGTLKSLFDEHLKILQEECDKQKKEINVLLQHDRLYKRIEQQEKRLLKFRWLLLGQFGLQVLMALLLLGRQ